MNRKPAAGRLGIYCLLVLLGTLVVAGCSSVSGHADTPAQVASTGSQAASDESARQTPELSGEIVVFAAASLTEAFSVLQEKFGHAHRGVTVIPQFAGSTTLATQLLSGAPADVYASANTAQMQRVIDAGLTDGAATVFVTNTLEIVVPEGNPGHVTGLADFGNKDLTIALCAPKVPCGALSQELFTAAGIDAAPDTLEQNVKAVLTKVRLGEVDAGLVYRTDVASATGPVQGIEFPEANAAANDYSIATMGKSQSPAAAAFVAFVLSPPGQQVMKSFGFTSAVS